MMEAVTDEKKNIDQTKEKGRIFDSQMVYNLPKQEMGTPWACQSLGPDARTHTQTVRTPVVRQAGKYAPDDFPPALYPSFVLH